MSETAFAVLVQPELDLNADEARTITDKIRATVEQLHLLLLEAFKRNAWAALGYANFVTYVKAEFGYERAHAYRLLDHARVVCELERAAHSPVGDSITGRDARAIKPKLADVIDAVQTRIAHGEAPAVAVRAAIDAARGTAVVHAETADDRDDLTGDSSSIETIVLNIEMDTDFKVADLDRRLFDVLDANRIVRWAATLRKSVQRITELADRLEAEATRRL